LKDFWQKKIKEGSKKRVSLLGMSTGRAAERLKQKKGGEDNRTIEGPPKLCLSSQPF